MKQEFNQMQLEFIEHIKSVRNAYYWDTDEFLTTFKLVLNDAKREAIAEHEASQWKKYPENKPEGKTKYIVQYYDNSIDVLLYFGGKFTSYDNHVIAFRELPSSYQPTVTDNEAKNKSCRGCKYNVDTVLCSHPTPCRTDWENYNAG